MFSKAVFLRLARRNKRLKTVVMIRHSSSFCPELPQNQTRR
jgi:hypothetical protein